MDDYISRRLADSSEIWAGAQMTERESPDLPECSRVGAHDMAARDALIRDGWRMIGFLTTFERECFFPFGRRSKLVRSVQPAEVLRLAEQINWNGRYWRDKEVSKDAAWRQMRRSILATPGDVYMLKDAAFGIFSCGVVRLIGVHPAAYGFGFAKTLLKHGLHGRKWISAGTYFGNVGAMRLYKSLGMKAKKSEAVFHK